MSENAAPELPARRSALTAYLALILIGAAKADSSINALRECLARRSRTLRIDVPVDEP